MIDDWWLMIDDWLMNKLVTWLFDEFYGKWIFKSLSFVGADCRQNGIDHIDDDQGHMNEARNTSRPKQSSKSKIVAADMDA